MVNVETSVMNERPIKEVVESKKTCEGAIEKGTPVEKGVGDQFGQP